MTRITAAAPEALIYECNQLAMCLAYGPADGETYVGLNWVDADGNLYAATSFEASYQWIIATQSPLVRPAWDTEETIDMDAAAEAPAVLVYSTEAVLAIPGQLTAMGGPNGPEALALMGLTAYTTNGQ
jgi:hypothetical protein